tara:strand:+ start:146 stop:295 length:150 start_codon:yes stop_codon:yes gene_type:complete
MRIYWLLGKINMTVLEIPADILKFRRQAFLAYDWDAIQSQKGCFLSAIL